MSWKRYHHRVGWPVGWPPSSTQNHQPRPLVATWLPHPRVASFCRWATYKTTCEDTRGEGRGWVGRWLDGPGPKVLDGAFGALFFFFVFFCPGKERKKHRKFRGGGKLCQVRGLERWLFFFFFYCFRLFWAEDFTVYFCVGIFVKYTTFGWLVEMHPKTGKDFWSVDREKVLESKLKPEFRCSLSVGSPFFDRASVLHDSKKWISTFSS